jgi:hypothetical protein
VPGGALAEAEAEGGGTAEVTVEEHWYTVTVVVTVSEGHRGQPIPSCGVRSAVAYHEVAYRA